MDKADDAEILEFARSDGWTCITLDHDFHTHLALARSGAPSVVLLRVQGLNADAQAELIRSIWTVCEEEIKHGAAVSADRDSVRVRKLPLR